MWCSFDISPMSVQLVERVGRVSHRHGCGRWSHRGFVCKFLSKEYQDAYKQPRILPVILVLCVHPSHILSTSEYSALEAPHVHHARRSVGITALTRTAPVHAVRERRETESYRSQCYVQ